MQGMRMLRSLRLTNLLSYGSNGASIDLEPLNVLIGPNASGKSNLIEAISLLAATPKDLLTPIREGGGVAEWIWKGKAPGVSGVGGDSRLSRRRNAAPLSALVHCGQFPFRDYWRSDRE